MPLLPLLVSCLAVISPFTLTTSLYARGIANDGAAINGRSFDYVVVGGGTSGLTAAHKLSEDSSKSVLVIEAGGDPRQNDKITDYSKYTTAFNDDELDWTTSTVPQQSANGKQVSLHAGKGIGGTSNINGGEFSAPPSTQIDAIGQLGNQGWNWKTFLPYFKIYQDYHAPTTDQINLGMSYDPASHGLIGPVDVSYPTSRDVHATAVRSSLKEQLNIPFAGDLGSGNVAGTGFLATFSQPDSPNTRVSSATAFLTPIEANRSNLVVLLNARVTRIVWKEGATPATASGVEYQMSKGGPTYSIQAKQVVVAAGAIRSPKLLELSGVGDAKVLKKIGVKQVVALPGVGANLIEQAKTQIEGGTPKAGTLDRKNNVVSFVSIDKLITNTTEVQQNIESQIDGWAQTAVDSGASASKEGLLLQYRTMIQGIFQQNWPAVELYYIAIKGTTFIQAWGTSTFSRGSTHATRNSVWTKSDIDPRYFAASIDMDVQVAAMRGARKAFQGQAFKDVIDGQEKKPGFEVNSGGIPQGAKYGRYDRWEKYILDTYESVWHLIGTCAMMPEKLGGVVGPDFKVYQTSNVWVIDASVIPIPLATHTTSVVYALASKAAQIISQV